ncbi:MAG: hypothetical protein M0042_06235, partial [Nitrospiraceae bacterium]|nr:hypothetical protein [Nitrospiraceae bacterium]
EIGALSRLSFRSLMYETLYIVAILKGNLDIETKGISLCSVAALSKRLSMPNGYFVQHNIL